MVGRLAPLAHVSPSAINDAERFRNVKRDNATAKGSVVKLTRLLHRNVIMADQEECVYNIIITRRLYTDTIQGPPTPAKL